MTRILVIESETRARHALRNMLEGAGYQVDIAVDGSHAAEMHEANPADLVIADGIEPPPAGAPVLAVPGGGAMRFRAAWAQAMLPKPFRRDDLLAAVRATLQQQRDRPGTRV